MPRIVFTICAALVLSVFSLRAQVPQMISYQGRVLTNGTAFSGTGLFKFALVNGGVTNIGAQATATANVIGGVIASFNVINQGSNYVTTPLVTITDSTGSGAQGVAVVSGGKVTGILVQQGGSGYSASPVVTVAPPPTQVFTTYWSNDGTSAFGVEPTGAIPLTVNGGLLMVLLGNTSLTNMLPVPPSVFTNAYVQLRIWFNDGIHGFAQLGPDQRIVSVGYAMIANTVPDASITSAKLAPGAVTGSSLGSNVVTSINIVSNAVGTLQITNGAITSPKIADGAVGTTQLADGSVTSNKIAAGAVVSSKIAAGAVLTANIANLAVGSNQIADASITTAKLADSAVTSTKLGNQAVQTLNIADAAVGVAQISPLALGGIQQVIRGVVTVGGPVFQVTSNFSPVIDPTKSFVILSSPVQTGSSSGLTSDKAALISLTTTSLTVAVDFSGSLIATQKVSYQIIQSK